MAVEASFPVPADQVFSLLTDADFLVDRALDLGDLSADCTVEDDGRQIVVAMTREVEGALPPFLARLLEPRQVLDQAERWKQARDVRHGSLQTRLGTQPVTIEAEMRLKPQAGGGCTYSIGFTVTANVPLIGRRVESWVMEQMETRARAELDYLRDALRR